MKLEEEAKEFLKRKNMSNITATEYQNKAKETAIFPADKALEYLSLGLVGEAGEVANKVKKILVNPKSTLSLQIHNFRSEHWVVVEGIAEVTINKKIKILNKGDSVFIPVKSKHRLCNRKNKNLIIIEIQTGSYFGEDDIIRLDDPYER